MAKRIVPKTKHYLACYALFTAVIVLCYGMFAIWPQTILLLVVGMADSYDGMLLVKVIYGLSTIVIGLSLLTVVLATESYLRNGIPVRKMRYRFVRIAVPLVILDIVGIIGHFAALAVL